MRPAQLPPFRERSRPAAGRASRDRNHPQPAKIPRAILTVAPLCGRLFPGQTARSRMKAKIIITPKKAVVDPQGITVKKALEHMGYSGVTGVHIGKYIEIDLAPGTDKAAAQKAIDDAAHKLLSNPIIEDYKLEIE
jgi:phosphoribosylformylglycinamidine synthase